MQQICSICFLCTCEQIAHMSRYMWFLKSCYISWIFSSKNAIHGNRCLTLVNPSEFFRSDTSLDCQKTCFRPKTFEIDECYISMGLQPILHVQKKNTDRFLNRFGSEKCFQFVPVQNLSFKFAFASWCVPCFRKGFDILQEQRCLLFLKKILQ